jgi:membrane dipeptidase
MPTLHERALVVDGLQICRWERAIFEEQRDAGIDVVNCTVSVWEDFRETMETIATFHRWFEEWNDLIRPVVVASDIEAARREGRVGIVLGFQNLGAIEGRLSYLRLFHRLGLRVAQLAYNTQNLIGAGCYERNDSGLTDFGREVVGELNRLGILIDLSHVGPRTSHDAILCSERPVAYTHVCPAALNPHPRNRTDEELRFLADRGGFVGVNLLPWFLRSDGEATIEHFVDAIEHTLRVVGEDAVGIGTDFMQGHGRDFLEWLRRDGGRGRLVSPLPPADRPYVQTPHGLDRIADLPKLADVLERRGWSEERILKTLGGNWARFLGEAWN